MATRQSDARVTTRCRFRSSRGVSHCGGSILASYAHALGRFFDAALPLLLLCVLPVAFIFVFFFLLLLLLLRVAFFAWSSGANTAAMSVVSSISTSSPATATGGRGNARKSVWSANAALKHCSAASVLLGAWPFASRKCVVIARA